MVIYYSGTPVLRSGFDGLILMTSLGNIGAAKPACNTGRSRIYLQCANGYFDKLTDFGMIPRTK